MEEKHTVRQWRNLNNFRQEDVQKYLGIKSLTTYRTKESDPRKFSFEETALLLKLFGIKFEQINV